ncbi:hypothetical protein GCM10010402_07860 [Actinomadura luteofluorescens]
MRASLVWGFAPCPLSARVSEHLRVGVGLLCGLRPRVGASPLAPFWLSFSGICEWVGALCGLRPCGLGLRPLPPFWLGFLGICGVVGGVVRASLLAAFGAGF